MSKEALDLFKQAICELNEQLEDSEQVVCDNDTRFIGSNSCIDSISFVTLSSIIQDLVLDKYEKKDTIS